MLDKIANIVTFIADVSLMFVSSLGMGSLIFSMFQIIMFGGQPPALDFLGLAGYITGLILWSFKCWSDLNDMKKE